MRIFGLILLALVEVGGQSRGSKQQAPIEEHIGMPSCVSYPLQQRGWHRQAGLALYAGRPGMKPSEGRGWSTSILHIAPG